MTCVYSSPATPSAAAASIYIGSNTSSRAHAHCSIHTHSLLCLIPRLLESLEINRHLLIAFNT